MLTDGRIKQFWMLGCCVITNISWNMLFNSNLKALVNSPYICGITATLKFINQIALLEDREHIFCNILTFDPAKNAIPRWCTWRRWHILIAVMRGNRAGGNWLMKWDELKKFPWYTHRLIHRKRVICELHDSYFCLMTIKHTISKIEWAIEWALNYYITQSRQKTDSLVRVPVTVGDGYRRDVVEKTTPGRRSLGLWWVGVLRRCW